MIKEIKYNGYSASPSDYECADGDLAMSLNAINEDGSIKPLLSPKIIMCLEDGEKVVCVHETSVIKHYIVINELNIMTYRSISSEGGLWIGNFYGKTIHQVTPVGNTLIVLTSEGMFYFLWKDDRYIFLGDEIPELNVFSYIKTEICNQTKLFVKLRHEIDRNLNLGLADCINTELFGQLYSDSIEGIPLYGETRLKVYERLFAVLNSWRHTAREQGYLIEPFYVRCAYRMFDGTHIRHTVPVLLIPTTAGGTLWRVSVTDSSGTLEPLMSLSELMADITLPDNIELWKDLITDIDVFVSEPLVSYSDDPETLSSIKKLPFYTKSDTGWLKTGQAPLSMCMEEGVLKWKDIDDMEDFLNYTIGPTISVPQNHKYGINFAADIISVYLVVDVSQESIYIGNELGQQNVLVELNDAEKSAFFATYGISGNYDVYNLSDYIGQPKILFFTEETTSFFFVLQHSTGIIDKPHHYIELIRTDNISYEDTLNNCTAFYKVAELKITDFENNMFSGKIPIKTGELINITTHQTLSDIAQNHNQPISDLTFVYNNRVNIILREKRIRNACTSLRKQNPARKPALDIDFNGGLNVSQTEVNKAYVEIYENGQYAYVEIPVDEKQEMFFLKDLLMFSFPDINARNLCVYCTTTKYMKDINTDTKYYKCIIPLTRHEFLNQSFAFNNFDCLKYEREELVSPDDFMIPTANIIEYGNIIYLSDVNNPFRFSEEYTVSLPVSKIYALSTAAKALSQGQFGQYPLYAFTSDGIWALELTSTGTYSARQPISRDVVINPDSITQLDSAVLFATQRGIMLLSGSDVTCISDRLNTEDVFDINNIPKIDQLISIYNSITSDDELIDKKDIRYVSFKEFIQECRMIYDYSHQHLIVYNPTISYAYVYSFQSQKWGMMISRVTDNVLSYPEALAMADNVLVDFSDYQNKQTAVAPPEIIDPNPDDPITKGASDSVVDLSMYSNTVLLITRPFKMEQPDVHKTISTIIQRGDLKNKNIAQILYGSNDTCNWSVVWSSNDIKMSGFRGTPYKYYMIAVVRNLNRSESLRGFSVQYEHRLTNKLR